MMFHLRVTYRNEWEHMDTSSSSYEKLYSAGLHAACLSVANTVAITSDSGELLDFCAKSCRNIWYHFDSSDHTTRQLAERK